MNSRRLTSMGGLPCVLMLVSAFPPIAQTTSGDPRTLLGTWRGTSTCVDRVAAPACNDEDVVYEFSRGPKPGTVHWIADKVVNGQRERMGESDLAYDTDERCWTVEMNARRKSLWRLAVDGTHLTGTAHLLPGRQTIRKLDLHKE